MTRSFARIAKTIAGYVNGTLLDANSHTFYSHQDADAFAGDDGSYYTWTEDEVRHLLKERDLQIALLHFGFTNDPGRAPDGRIVLRDAMSADDIAHRLENLGDGGRRIDQPRLERNAQSERKAPRSASRYHHSNRSQCVDGVGIYRGS